MNWSRLPPLAALRALAAFAETGSFSRAAAMLNVTHAAVSQQIRGLEERLGHALVRRDGRGAALTLEGERLGRALERGFSTIAQAIEELTGGDPARPVQATMTPLFAANWLMPRLFDFRRRHPGIELMLNPTVAVVPLAPGGVELAIRFGEGGWPGVEAELLVPVSMVIVAAPELIGDRRIDGVEDLLDLPWFQEFGFDEIGSWLARQGSTLPRPARVTHLPGPLVLEAARGGGGVCAVARGYVEADIAAGRLRVLFEEERPGWGYYAVTRPGVQRPALRTFLGWLRRQALRPEAALDPDQCPAVSGSLGVASDEPAGMTPGR
jgi:LysR family glycine cleavage system transcriptional activator